MEWLCTYGAGVLSTWLILDEKVLVMKESLGGVGRCVCVWGRVDMHIDLVACG